VNVNFGAGAVTKIGQVSGGSFTAFATFDNGGSNKLTLTGNAIFGSNVRLGGTSLSPTDAAITLGVFGSTLPEISFYRSGGTTDQKIWQWHADDTSMNLRAVNDANNQANYAIRFIRSGYTMKSVQLFGLTAPINTYNVLVHGLTDSAIYQVPLSSFGATTIYNGNGTLSAERNVSSGGFTLRFDGANNSDTIMTINNSGTSGIGAYAFGSLKGMDIQSTNLGLYVFGTTQGMQVKSSTNEAIFAQSDGMRAAKLATNLAATNTVDEVLNIQRVVNAGVGADGIGAAITLSAENTSGTQVTTAQLVGKFTTATSGAEISQFSVVGVNSSSTNTILTIDGDGTYKTFGKRIIPVTVSSAGTLNIGNSEGYVFSGTTTTWTLPAISGNTGVKYYIKNRGSGSITLNSNAGGNDIYDTSATNTLTITAGTSKVLVNDGTYWTVQ